LNVERLLLDTHTFLWWMTNDPRLSRGARRLIEESSASVYLSAASCREIATKFQLGKLPVPSGLALDVEAGALESGLIPLSITFKHYQVSAQLPRYHKDPFDRLLIAQALVESMTVLSVDAIFDGYQVPRLW